MITPSILFYLFFAVPYVFAMYWLVRQDKKRHAWGMAVVTLIAVLGIYASQKASRNAVQNYRQHQADAREAESENR